MSKIKDINLYKQGDQKIEWVKKYMPVLAGIEQDFIKEQPFKNIKIAMAIHLEAKTAYLAKVLHAGGATMYVAGSNPLSTQDDVVAALAKSGIEVYAKHGCTDKEYDEYIEDVLSPDIDLILDDGGDLTAEIHKDEEKAKRVFGGAEETTTGIIRLKARAKAGKLLYPVMSVNDANCKSLFDNRYGTGQSSWEGVMRASNLVIAGKCVVVGGYGWCSRGIAAKAAGLGARVIVTEVNAIKALEAVMDGFDVMSMDDAAPLGDIFITATGCIDVVTTRHFKKMKDGVLLANAGHFDVEVRVSELEKLSVSKKEMRNNIIGYVQEDGRILNLIAEGRLVNLAAADGHPAEIMDLSFALQALSLKYVLENYKTLKNDVIDVPYDIDYMVAERKLKAMDKKMDYLSKEQIEYLNS
jgi:adenosylhomocysteinase